MTIKESLSIKEKTLGYWIGVVAALLALVGLGSSWAVRLSDTERKTKEIPGIEWDIRVVKSMLAGMRPGLYDSVIANEIRINGHRPEEE